MDEVLVQAWMHPHEGVTVSIESGRGRSDYVLSAKRAAALAEALRNASIRDLTRPKPKRHFTDAELDEITREVSKRIARRSAAIPIRHHPA